MTDYTDIITRLEAAGGADRKIDCLVAITLDGFWIDGERYGEPLYFRRDRETGAIVEPGSEGDMMVPRYTASLDASLALVEEKLPGWAWSVGILANGGQAYLMRQQGCNLIEGKAPTPPLAVLLALFRALNTTEET